MKTVALKAVYRLAVLAISLIPVVLLIRFYLVRDARRPSPTPAPAGVQVRNPQSTWTYPGTPPLADAAAAARVTHQPETRPDNVQANGDVPTDSELASFRAASNQYGQRTVQVNPLTQYVTGRPGLANPSTDDLIQWTAHKWGISEDVIRAQMATESSWHQSTLGDRTTVSSNWYGLYPAQARIAGTSDVYESMGAMQIKWHPDGSVGQGTDPLRWKSTAFNLDFYAAVVRYYYDGDCGWCTSGYSAGQSWNSSGAWYSPYPWANSGAQGYVSRVQTNLTNRVWAQPGF